MIAIVYLSPWPIGGSTSYTIHLYKALKAAGEEVAIYKLGKRTENFSRELGNFGIHYTNLSLEDLIEKVKNNPSLMTAAAPSKKLPDPFAIEKLVKNGMRCVIHDPNEFKVYDHANLVTDPIVIRPTMKKYYKNAVYIPHPYSCRYLSDVNYSEKKLMAASLARITFCKNCDIILEANARLPKNSRVVLLGGANRMYLNFNLSKKFDDIDLSNSGLPRTIHSQPEAIKPFRFNVDLTDFSHLKDGGGTQYSFMEAMDGGAVNIIHDAWLLPKGEMKKGINCLSIGSPEELVYIIKLFKGSNDYRDECSAISLEAKKLLKKKHNPKSIGKIYSKVLNS